MLKSTISFIASVAIVAGSGAAMAHSGHHVASSRATNVVLEGPASLGLLQCWLTAVVDLRENVTAHPGGHGTGLYNEVYNVRGTNVANPSPQCPAITLTGGDGRVTAANTITLDNLIIQVGSNPPCNAGPLTMTVTNGTTTSINATVNDPTNTCGAIAADLDSIDPDPSVQIQ